MVFKSYAAGAQWDRYGTKTYHIFNRISQACSLLHRKKM